MKHAASWIPRDPIAWGVLALGITGIQLAPYGTHRAWMIAAMLMSGAGTVWLWLQDRLSTRQVLAGALVARFAAFPLAPSVTDDIYRYIWDGWMQLEGVNPYRFRPADWMEAVRDSSTGSDTLYSTLFPYLNSSEYFSVYPPVSQLIFLFGAAVDAAIGSRGDWIQSYYGIKAGFALLEIGGLALLARMIPARALVLYAWSPLVILETAGQGHTEAALVFFVVVAVWAVRQQRAVLASVFIGGAAMVKLYPILLLPLLWRRFGWRGVWPGLVSLIVVSVPYAAVYTPANVLTSLNLYVSLFEFFAGPYFAVKHALLTLTGTDFSKTIGPVFRVLFLLSVPVIYALDARRSWGIERAMLWILGGFLVLSTTVHPWYLLAMLPLCVLVIGRSDAPDKHIDRAHRTIPVRGKVAKHAGLIGWLWLATIAPATYGFYTGQAYWLWVWVGWGGASLWAGAHVYLGRKGSETRDDETHELHRRGLRDAITRCVIEPIQRRRARAKAQRLLPWLPTPVRVARKYRVARKDNTHRASSVSPDGNGHASQDPGMSDAGPPSDSSVSSETSPKKTRVLDLGAGEGYVGEALASGSTQLKVQLCDVADLNRTGLPHDIYTGETLPYADDAFDAVVLYFVLHHCEHPEQVLSEALRVSTQRVIIVESVVTGRVQHRLLRCADIAANRIRSGGSLGVQEKYLDFRSTDDWVQAVEKEGGQIQDVTAWPGRIHPQTRIVAKPCPTFHD